MSEKLKFDMTQMYYRQPFKVNDRITIYQPSVGDIIEFGENDFYNSVLNPFVTNSSVASDSSLIFMTVNIEPK